MFGEMFSSNKYEIRNESDYIDFENFFKFFIKFNFFNLFENIIRLKINFLRHFYKLFNPFLIIRILSYTIFLVRLKSNIKIQLAFMATLLNQVNSFKISNISDISLAQNSNFLITDCSISSILQSPNVGYLSDYILELKKITLSSSVVNICDCSCMNEFLHTLEDKPALYSSDSGKSNRRLIDEHGTFTDSSLDDWGFGFILTDSADWQLKVCVLEQLFKFSSIPQYILISTNDKSQLSDFLYSLGKL